MKVFESNYDFTNVESSNFLRQSCVLRNPVKQVSTRSEVDDPVDVVLALDIPLKRNDKWVVDHHQDMFLILHIVIFTPLSDYFFVDRFHGVNLSCALTSDDIHN